MSTRGEAPAGQPYLEAPHASNDSLSLSSGSESSPAPGGRGSRPLSWAQRLSGALSGSRAGDVEPVDNESSALLAKQVTETPIPERYDKYHRASRHEEETGFSFFVAVCFTINYIVGCGFLGMPNAFVKAGMIQGTVFTIVLSYLCNLTKDYYLEAMCRSEAITEYTLKSAAVQVKVQKVPRLTAMPEERSASRARAASDEGAALAGRVASTSSSKDGDISNRELNGPEVADGHYHTLSNGGAGAMTSGKGAKPGRQDSFPPASPSGHAMPHTYAITHRKFETTEMVELFFGVNAKRWYTTAVALFMYGVLWAFSSVFASSAAANIPVSFLHDGTTCSVYADYDDCFWNYHFFLLIFAVVVVPMSCVELKEQVYLQVTMSIARFIVMGLLVATVLAAADCGGETFEDHHSQFHHVSMWDMSGLVTIVPVAAYAQVFHLSIPVLSQSVKKKVELPKVFGTTFLITTFLYILMAAVMGLYFGGAMVAQCNVLWEKYVGCMAEGTTASHRPLWAAAVAFTVLIFPALDVMSAYPLNAITLGNNLLSAWAGERAPKWEANRRIRIGFRLVAAIPPIIGASFVVNLDTILSYTGLVSFFVAFYAPCLLVDKARARCDKLFPRDKGLKTDFNSPFDFGQARSATLVLTGIIGLFVLVSLVLNNLGIHMFKPQAN